MRSGSKPVADRCRDGVVDPGGQLGSYNPNNITFDQNVTYDSGSILGANLTPKLADNVDQIINDLESGALVPSQINNVVVGNTLPDTLMSGTVHVVNTPTLSLEKNYAVSDVIITVRGDIDWGKMDTSSPKT